MWIEDLTKAFWMLNSLDIKWNCCVDRVEDGYIYMTNFNTRFAVKDLVAEYDKEYGATRSDNVRSGRLFAQIGGPRTSARVEFSIIPPRQLFVKQNLCYNSVNKDPDLLRLL